jgi:hypothetical protein
MRGLTGSRGPEARGKQFLSSPRLQNANELTRRKLLFGFRLRQCFVSAAVSELFSMEF